MSARHDWPLIRERYVTSDLSLAQLRDETGISLRALAGRSKREGWPALRVAHVNDIASQVHQETARRQVQTEVATKDAVRTVLRSLMRRFADLVRANAVELTVRDFIEASKLALLLEGQLPAEQLRLMFGKPPEEMSDDELTAAVLAEAEAIVRDGQRTSTD